MSTRGLTRTWFCLTTFNWLSDSLFFTHLFACPCGSIIRGQRLLSNSIIALSMLKLSFGSLSITHPRILTASPNVVSSRKFSLQGMFLAPNNLAHWEIACSRNADVNAPMYAMTPEDSVMSPARKKSKWGETPLRELRREGYMVFTSSRTSGSLTLRPVQTNACHTMMTGSWSALKIEDWLLEALIVKVASVCHFDASDRAIFINPLGTLSSCFKPFYL